jgi:hypothetical protein
MKGKRRLGRGMKELATPGTRAMPPLTEEAERFAPRAKRVPALMSTATARSLSLCESGLPVKGRAWRHRLSRVPACRTSTAEPQALRMLDGPSAPFRYRFFDTVKPRFAHGRERGVSAPVSALADAQQPPKAIFSEP